MKTSLNQLLKNIFTLAILLTAVAGLSACGKETDADKIADAQSCLDNATTSTVDDCLMKVQGLESESANLIRCAGAFIKEGYSTPSKLSTALSNLTSGSGGNSGADTVAVIAALAFSTKSTPALNATFAQETYDTCVKSKSNGLILLSGLSVTSTTLWSLGLSGSTTPPTAAQIESLMGSLASNTQAASVVGEAVVSMYESNCQSSNSAPGSMCAQFQTAVSNVSGGLTNPSAIGTQIMTCFSNPSAAGCSNF